MPSSSITWGRSRPREPLAVAAHLQPPGGGEIQQGALGGLPLAQLLQIGGGVGLDRRFTELHPGGALAGGIADAGGEIANDQNRCVARVLKRPQLAEQERVAQVDGGAGGVDAELHPQRPAAALAPSRRAAIADLDRCRHRQVPAGKRSAMPRSSQAGRASKRKLGKTLLIVDMQQPNEHRPANKAKHNIN